jgi:hypothetical protein
VALDQRELLANLAEKERLKGHHSAEGQAIRLFARALTGWTAGNLSALDVLVLCEQSMEDWFKARLQVKPWSSRGLPDLLGKAIERELVTKLDAVRLQKMHLLRVRLDDRADARFEVESSRFQVEEVREVEEALELCIRVVGRHW